MKQKKRKDKGFTLTELLVVIVIVGILSSIAVVATTKYIDNAKKEIDNQNEETIVEAAKSYLESNPTKWEEYDALQLYVDIVEADFNLISSPMIFNCLFVGSKNKVKLTVIILKAMSKVIFLAQMLIKMIMLKWERMLDWRIVEK